jgi:hypothetical protein
MIRSGLRKARQVIVANMLLGICLSQVAIAQDDSPEATSAPDEIDEIVVLGGRTLTKLRDESTVAEDRFFELYNDLNEDDRYDIICKHRRPVGTRIQVRECKPKFVRDAEIKATRDSLQMADSLADITAQAIRVSREDYEILDEKLKSFTVSSPEMQEALMDYDRLNKRYAEEHEKKYD